MKAVVRAPQQQQQQQQHVAVVYGSVSEPVEGRWSFVGRVVQVEGLGSEMTLVSRHCRDVLTVRVPRDHSNNNYNNNNNRVRFLVVQSCAPLELRAARHYCAVLRPSDTLTELRSPPNAAFYPDPKLYTPLDSLPRDAVFDVVAVVASVTDRICTLVDRALRPVRAMLPAMREGQLVALHGYRLSSNGDLESGSLPRIVTDPQCYEALDLKEWWIKFGRFRWGELVAMERLPRNRASHNANQSTGSSSTNAAGAGAPNARKRDREDDTSGAATTGKSGSSSSGSASTSGRAQRVRPEVDLSDFVPQFEAPRNSQDDAFEVADDVDVDDDVYFETTFVPKALDAFEEEHLPPLVKEFVRNGGFLIDKTHDGAQWKFTWNERRIDGLLRDMQKANCFSEIPKETVRTEMKHFLRLWENENNE